MKEWLWGVRRNVSLLQAYGHPQSPFYPIGMLVDEVRLVSEMLNSQLAAEAVMMQLASASVHSKQGLRDFKKAMKRLTDG